MFILKIYESHVVSVNYIVIIYVKTFSFILKPLYFLILPMVFVSGYFPNCQDPSKYKVYHNIFHLIIQILMLFIECQDRKMVVSTYVTK